MEALHFGDTALILLAVVCISLVGWWLWSDRPPLQRRAIWWLLIGLFIWCGTWGSGLAEAMTPMGGSGNVSAQTASQVTPLLAQTAKPQPSGTIGTVDLVPPRLQLAQETYLATCATCHIGVPPAVLPTKTWLDLIQDTQHYGVDLKPLVDPNRLLVWNYLRTYSRPQHPDDSTPYRVGDSRYFRILHPKVELPRKVPLSSCVTCHPGANQYNFRSLTAEWEKAP